MDIFHILKEEREKTSIRVQIDKSPIRRVVNNKKYGIIYLYSVLKRSCFDFLTVVISLTVSVILQGLYVQNLQKLNLLLQLFHNRDILINSIQYLLKGGFPVWLE